MQVVAVEDIGKVVARIFSNKDRFGGKTIKIASDTITGNRLQAILSEVIGHPISYTRLADDLLSPDSDLGQIAMSLEEGPLSKHVSLDLMREIIPDLTSLRSWLEETDHEKLQNTFGYQ